MHWLMKKGWLQASAPRAASTFKQHIQRVHSQNGQPKHVQAYNKSKERILNPRSTVLRTQLPLRNLADKLQCLRGCVRLAGTVTVGTRGPGAAVGRGAWTVTVLGESNTVIRVSKTQTPGNKGLKPSGPVYGHPGTSLA